MPELVYKAPERGAAAPQATAPVESKTDVAESAGESDASAQPGDVETPALSAEQTSPEPVETAGAALPAADEAEPPKAAEIAPPPRAAEQPRAPATAYWLLSLFAPAENEGVDWQRGSYSVLTRGGRVESPARWGDEKKLLRMVEEGSVILSEAPPKGAAPDVAPDGFPHPVFRAGFAVAVPIILRASERPTVAP
jgi:hypothetical protein